MNVIKKKNKKNRRSSKEERAKHFLSKGFHRNQKNYFLFLLNKIPKNNIPLKKNVNVITYKYIEEKLASWLKMAD